MRDSIFPPSSKGVLQVPNYNCGTVPQILRRHPQEEVHAEKSENGVGRPGGQERWELADRTHRFEERGGGPINESDADRDGQATDGAARSGQKGKGRA